MHSPTQARVPWLRLVAPTALFLLGFGAVTWAIHVTTPRNPGREMGLRIERLRELAPELDTLFIGSSRVQRGVDPALFDELTAAAGHPTRSFNLGIPGLDALDADLLLREVAEARPPNLRWVIVDPEKLAVFRPAAQTLNRRSIAAHGGPVLSLIARYGRETDASLGLKLGEGFRHATAAFYQYFNVARCIPVVRDWIGSAPRGEVLEGELGRNLDGFYRAEDLPDPVEVRRRRFHKAEQERYMNEVALLANASVDEAPLPEHEAAFYVNVMRRIEALGAQPILMYFPGPEQRFYLRKLKRDGHVEHFFDYGDPLAYPEFFLKTSRFDRTHLNERGATLFTRQLAKDFAAWLEREGP